MYNLGGGKKSGATSVERGLKGRVKRWHRRVLRNRGEKRRIRKWDELNGAVRKDEGEAWAPITIESHKRRKCMAKEGRATQEIVLGESYETVRHKNYTAVSRQKGKKNWEGLQGETRQETR